MFAAAVVSVLWALASTGEDPVKVSVYYETLCPDSARFFTGQLYPVWSELKDIITLDVNCYGKANYTAEGEGFSFHCQHGAKECEGNMMVTCAKKYITDEDQFMAFSNCIMDRFVGAAAGEECANEAGVDFNPIKTCYTSVEGQQLLQQVGVVEETLDPKLYYVPWILINDVFSAQQLLEAQMNLRKVVCEAYQGMLPPACTAY